MKKKKQKTKLKQTEIGKIPEGWKVMQVEDLIKHRKGFAFKSRWFQKLGKRIIRVSNFTSDSIDISDSLFISEEKAKELKDFEIFKGDIIIATVGSWPNNPASIVGKVIKVTKEAESSLMNQNAVILRTRNENEVNQNFLYYRLKNKDFSHYLISGAQGSANQASITLRDIFSFEFGLPEIQEQKAIVKILSVLDAKIKLNQQMNKYIEAIGKVIFKKWFVDFEFQNEYGKPYKSSGGKMIDSELGKIPQSWNVTNLNNYVNFEKGSEPGSKNYSESKDKNNIRFIRVSDLSSKPSSRIYIPKELTNNKICNEEDILLSLDATIGIVEKGYNGAFSSGIRKVYSKNKKIISKSYLYWLLQTNYIQNIIKTYATGTTILHAGESINYMKIALPNKEIMTKFTEKIFPLFKKILNNLNEIKQLSQIRDSLLPKLMSGKIRVPIEVRK